jgi:hypothetical protein
MSRRSLGAFLAHLLLLGVTAWTTQKGRTFPLRKALEIRAGDYQPPSSTPHEPLLGPNPERLLALKKREAEVKLELERISAEKSALLQTRRLSIGIVGFGKFGQFLAKRFLAQGHSVSALSRAPLSPDACDMGVTYFGGIDSDMRGNDEGSGAWKFLSQPHLDVVVFAVRD